MREIRFLPIFIGISLLVVFAFYDKGFGLSAQTPITGDVSLSVMTADGTPVRSSVSGLELKTVKMVAKSGDSIKQLLKNNTIFPDMEAFGLVYDLNPALRNAGSITEGVELVLPKIERKDSQTILANGQLVALTVDSRLKAELLAKFEALGSISNTTTTNRLGVERFNNPNERQSTLKSLRDINDSFTAIGNVIEGKVRPINNEVLNQVKAEAELLQASLERLITQTEGKASAEDLNTIKLIDEDLKVKRRTLTDVRGPDEPPARWREVLVVVKTLGQDSRQVSNLRVYYVPEALRSHAKFIRSFDTLSSPSQRSLPEANYLIWAGKPGQEAEAAALSDVKKLPLRKTSDTSLSIDLSIIR